MGSTTRLTAYFPIDRVRPDCADAVASEVFNVLDEMTSRAVTYPVKLDVPGDILPGYGLLTCSFYKSHKNVSYLRVRLVTTDLPARVADMLLHTEVRDGILRELGASLLFAQILAFLAQASRYNGESESCSVARRLIIRYMRVVPDDATPYISFLKKLRQPDRQFSFISHLSTAQFARLSTSAVLSAYDVSYTSLSLANVLRGRVDASNGSGNVDAVISACLFPFCRMRAAAYIVDNYLWDALLAAYENVSQRLNVNDQTFLPLGSQGLLVNVENRLGCGARWAITRWSDDLASVVDRLSSSVCFYDFSAVPSEGNFADSPYLSVYLRHALAVIGQTDLCDFLAVMNVRSYEIDDFISQTLLPDGEFSRLCTDVGDMGYAFGKSVIERARRFAPSDSISGQISSLAYQLLEDLSDELLRSASGPLLSKTMSAIEIADRNLLKDHRWSHLKDDLLAAARLRLLVSAYCCVMTQWVTYATLALDFVSAADAIRSEPMTRLMLAVIRRVWTRIYAILQTRARSACSVKANGVLNTIRKGFDAWRGFWLDHDMHRVLGYDAAALSDSERSIRDLIFSRFLKYSSLED